MDISQHSSVGINYSATRDEQKRYTAYLIKVAVLIIITVGAAIVLGQFLSYSFYQNIFSIPDIAVPLVITFVVFLTFFFHSILFIKKKSILVLLAVASCIAIVVSFFSLADVPVMIGTLAFLLLLLYAVFETKAEIDTRIKIRFVRALNSVTTKVVLAVAVLLAATFYGTFMSRPLDEDNFLLPRASFNSILPLTQSLFRNLLGDVQYEKSLREITEEKVDAIIAQETGAGNIAQVSEARRQQLVNEYLAELQKGFESMLGARVDNSIPLSDALYDGLLERFNKADVGFKSTVLLVLAVLFIFSIQILTIVVRILLIPVAYLVYELLLRTKFAHIVYENTSKEIVTL